MASYRFLVQQISGHFDGCEYIHVPRADNEAADTLAQSESMFVSANPEVAGSGSGTLAVGPGTSAGGPRAAAPEPGPGTVAAGPGTPTTQQGATASNSLPPNPATITPVAVMTVVEAPSWAQPILNFLVSRVLPPDEVSAQQVQHRAGAYTIINRELVRRSATNIFQRCVETEKGIAILRDIHQGECGHHAASRVLVAKAFRHGFFWPTALDDAKDLVRKCRGCQRFSTKKHHRPQPSRPFPSPGRLPYGDWTWWDHSR
ncbi:uncharacterized protein [Aegilops tauschii subsp. strangulata]|uniref:uncharacterized protein n=1 Tax=Aegilops tauschii subsp. strangulata TaxID=200361 RepID=UPI00098ABC5E|nr:uncharacterized protein LOC109737804 [Aegilops tauschii subsp. strangulata]